METQGRPNTTSPANKKQDQLLTAQELAELWRVKLGWVYGKLHSRSMPIPVIRIGKYPRFRAVDAFGYIDQQVREQTAEAAR